MSGRTGRGLYIHIPFCRRRCSFCAFYLEIHQARVAEEFLSSLLTEMRLYGDLRLFGPEPMNSIYFGGGTPTTLSPQQLTTILSEAKHSFVLAHDAEVTLEAHPESVTLDGLRHLRDGGFTRISFGAESMNQEELDLVGRPGSVLNNTHVVIAAREAGFTDINLDLMYGLPGQTIESWMASLQRTIDLAPTHLSCYALTVEEGTGLQTAIQRGTAPAPDEALQNDMESLAEYLLDHAGYTRYELSNYCRSGFASRHNKLHWTGGQYLGLGPSAQSYVGSRRFGNVSDLIAYNRSLRDGTLPVAESEQLTRLEDSCERLVFGLRMTEGISLQDKELLTLPRLSDTIHELIVDDLLERQGERIRLTTRGRRYADSVAVTLLTSLDQPDRVPSP
ncbi:MAG: Oxygen-independent coproporphyrinogen-III oxidase-like protein YggW [Nitrospira sp.]|jgi:oxygen-independent coproporphyrinogen-3 oxidase|nr:MAG: Oxygen-independent coproporphyrinogen-III oxidase-like protein YggW [Nitrospira sp.]